MPIILSFVRARPECLIRIEGHSSENEGTEEERVLWGYRRTIAVREFLAQNGIERDRMYTVSVGDARPQAKGVSEMAWAQNRRVELVLENCSAVK
jgi:peptidoglycan-associated lipoprotein